MTTYWTTSTPVKRPEADMHVVAVGCEHCDVELGIRVLSSGRTVRRRWLWALLAFVGLATTAPLVLIVVTVEPIDNPLLETFWRAIGSVAATVVGFAAFVVGLALAILDQGIRIESNSSYNAQHSLLRREWGQNDRVVEIP